MTDKKIRLNDYGKEWRSTMFPNLLHDKAYGVISFRKDRAAVIYGENWHMLIIHERFYEIVTE